MYKKKLLKVDITVIQRPVSVRFECPHCEAEIEINYSDFCDSMGEYCDWEYSNIECPECNKEVEISRIDWD